ncbi:MAG: hypothetical protein RBR38_16650 [Desulfomicrobium apsheronum]|nr:hypothetical protein [Desulfomicrobium apsheronum]
MSMTVSIRIGAVRAGSYKGQRTHDLRKGKVPSYVDQERSKLNRGDDVPTLAKVHDMNRDQKHAARTAAQARYEAAQASGDKDELEAAKAAKNACRQQYHETGVVAYRGIVTFGKEAQEVIKTLTPEELERRVRESVTGSADVVHTSAFGLRLHLDETAPHAHFCWLATNEQGKKLNPNKYDCRRIQDLAAEPFKDLGLTRGKSKDLWIEEGADPSKYVHESVAELHERLPADLAKAREELAAAQDLVREAQEAARDAQRERDDVRAQLADVTQEKASVEAERSEIEAELQAKTAEVARLEAIQAQALALAKSKFPGKQVEVVTEKGMFSTKTKPARVYTAKDLDAYGKAIAHDACAEVSTREAAVGARERRIGQELGQLREQAQKAEIRATLLDKFAEAAKQKHPDLDKLKFDQVVKNPNISTGQFKEAAAGTQIEDQVKVACGRVEAEREKLRPRKSYGMER